MDKDKTEAFETEAGEYYPKSPSADKIDDVSSVVQRAAIRTRIQQQAEAKKKKAMGEV